MNSRVEKFFSYYVPYRKLFIADMVCALGVSATLLAIPLCVRYITKNLLESSLPLEGLWAQIYVMAAVILVLILLHAFCHSFVDYKGHMMGALMERDMRHELFDHYQKLSFRFYDQHRTADLMTRLSNDTFNLSELYHHGPEDLVISLLNFMGAFVILLNINVQLALVALTFLPIMGVYGFYFSRKMHHALRESRDRVSDINTQLQDTLEGIKVVQAFTNEAIESKKFSGANNRFLESRQEGYKNEAYFYNGLVTLTQLMSASVVVFGATRIVQGSLDLADLLTFLLYVVILIEPIQRLGNFIRLYQEGITGFNRFMEALEVEPDIQDEAGAIALSKVRGDIEFKKVSFKYREGYDHVLKDLSLNIKAGQYVALVGFSGAGKTTLCSLIPRFYELNEGEILIDGKNIRKVTLASLRKHIGLVQQDVYLFAGTVLENISYGNPKASEDEVVEAAKKANAHEFIMSLPKGYDTFVGERGVQLSGGQKQRLSLARVFLKNSPILIFDEATSSLDNESEKAIQKALEALVENRTVIVIAHRLTTIQRAERILVLTDRGIEEEGTHQELLEQGGVYAHLYKLQSRVEI